jgi:hypothetical protein
MGFYCVSKVHIERMYPHGGRYISVKWWDDVLQRWQEQQFDFEKHEDAMKFASSKIMEQAM